MARRGSRPPTLLDFGLTAYLSVRDLRPSAKTAAEALSALHDAAEAFAALLPWAAALSPAPDDVDNLWRVRETVDRLLPWLSAIGAPELAAEYTAMVERFVACVTTPKSSAEAAEQGGCFELVRALRPPLEAALADLGARPSRRS